MVAYSISIKYAGLVKKVPSCTRTHTHSHARLLMQGYFFQADRETWTVLFVPYFSSYFMLILSSS